MNWDLKSLLLLRYPVRYAPKYNFLFDDSDMKLSFDDNWTENIKWNNNWLARNRYGYPLLSLDGQYGGYRFRSEPISWKNTRFNSNGTYSYEDIDSNTINNSPWYKSQVSTYFNNNNITNEGKDFFRLYLTNSTGGGFDPKIQLYINSDFKNWQSITKGGVTYTTPQDFTKNVTGNLVGRGHNTQSGEVNYYIDKNGRVKTFRDVPEGYRVVLNLDAATNAKVAFTSGFGSTIRFNLIEPINTELNPNANGVAEELDDGIIDNIGYDPVKKKFDPLLSKKIIANKSDTIDITGLEQNSVTSGNTSGNGSIIEGEVLLETGNGAGNGNNGKGNNGKGNKQGNSTSNTGFNLLNPTYLDALRVMYDNYFNIKNNEEYTNRLLAPLVNASWIGRTVNGDYRALLEGYRQAARFLNRSPLTSNALIEHAAQLEAIEKGNQAISAGNQRDSLMYWYTAEQAWRQAKENMEKYLAVANENNKSLVALNNEIAREDRDTKAENMQNIDKFFGQQILELREEYQYLKERLRLRQEESEDITDKTYGVGADTLLLQELTKRYEEIQRNPNIDGSKEIASSLRRQMDLLQQKILALQTLNKLRRINPSGWETQWNNSYGSAYGIDRNGIITGIKPEYISSLKRTLGLIDEDKDSTDEYKKKAYEKASATYNGILELLKLKELVGNDFEVGSTIYTNKLGGTLDFLQKGGRVSYTVFALRNPFLGAGIKESYSSEKKNSSKSSETSQDEKTKDKLLSNIAETLKGVDGLNSDISILTTELINFFDVSNYLPSSDPSLFYSYYIKALNRVNQIKQSAKLFDSAYKALESSGSMTSPAIDENGRVYVGIAKTNEITKVTPEEYLNNKDKYALLHNNELLELRRNNPLYAFRDKDITEIAYNGTNIQEIHKYLKEFIGSLGEDKESTDLLIKKFGKEAIIGLETLKNLQSKGLSDAETNTIIANLNALTELNLSTSSQLVQAQYAINAIYGFLKPNMRTALLLHAGNEDNVRKLITTLVLKNVSSDYSFNINGITNLDENGQPIGGAGRNKKGGDGSSSEESEDRQLLNIVSGIGGTPDTITLNPGTKSRLSVDGMNYNVEGSFEKSSLSETLKNTKIMGISDPRKIYFGDLLLLSEHLSDIMYLGQGFSRVILPVTPSGSPDFSIFERFEKACQKVRNKGYNPAEADTKQEVASELAKALKELKLDNLVKGGMPNMNKVGLFLVTEGIGSTKAGLKKTKYIMDEPDADKDEIEKVLGGKAPDGKYYKYELDKVDWYNPLEWFGYGVDSVYRGTIYIPISNDKLLASTASGNKLKRTTAYEYAGESQYWQDNYSNYDYTKLANARDTSADKLNN